MIPEHSPREVSKKPSQGRNIIYYKTTIIINRPVDELFDYMIQFDDADQWADQVASYGKITDGPVGVGTRLAERVKTGPFSEELIWEITAFEPNRLVRFEADNALGRSQVSYLFDEAEDGAQLTAEVYIPLKGFYRYLRPVVQYLHQRNREGYLAKTKRIIEDQ